MESSPWGRLISAEVRMAVRHNKELDMKKMWDDYEAETKVEQAATSCCSPGKNRGARQKNYSFLRSYSGANRLADETAGHNRSRKGGAQLDNSNITKPTADTKKKLSVKKSNAEEDAWAEERRKQRKLRRTHKANVDLFMSDGWEGDKYYSFVKNKEKPSYTITDILSQASLPQRKDR